MTREERVREAFAALAAGSVEAVEAALAPDARWRAVEDGPSNCESRSQIVAVLGEQSARGRLEGSVEAVEEVGERRAIVAFRPAHPGGDQWPLEDGVRHVVLTFAGERIVEIKGCADRAAALAYARGGAGEQPGARPAGG